MVLAALILLPVRAYRAFPAIADAGRDHMAGDGRACGIVDRAAGRGQHVLRQFIPGTIGGNLCSQPGVHLAHLLGAAHIVVALFAILQQIAKLQGPEVDELRAFEQLVDQLCALVGILIAEKRLGFGGGGFGSLGNGIGGGASFGGVLSFLASAKGNAFSNAPGLSAYSSTVVTRPTVFPFARGGVPNFGIMGERSGKPHEAIFPLTKMAGGDLGVKVVDSGRKGPVTINQPIYVQGVVDDRTASQIAAKAGRESRRAMQRNGD